MTHTPTPEDQAVLAWYDRQQARGRRIGALSRVAFNVETAKEAVEATVTNKHGRSYLGTAHEKVDIACEVLGEYIAKEGAIV